MQTLNNVHQQFAAFFKSDILKPYAFLVSKKLDEGHICIDLDNLDEETDLLPFYDRSQVHNPRKLLLEPFVTTNDNNRQPFVLHKHKLYIERYFRYETSILNRLKKFVAEETAYKTERQKALLNLRPFIENLFALNKSTLADAEEKIEWQLVAALAAVLNQFTIITGGPGTGKTTTVAKILAILFAINPQLKVALAAPTGKAAVRMAESLKSSTINVDKTVQLKFEAIVPGTIHRLLQYVSGSPYFKHNAENPLMYDVVVIDEASMVDVALFSKLFSAIGSGTRLIMLGDKDQLASVEAGSLFGDLCKAQGNTQKFSGSNAGFINRFIKAADAQIETHFITTSGHLLTDHVVELRQSHRFAGNKGIGRFSKAVIQNDTAILNEFIENNADEQVFIDLLYSSQLFEQFIDGYTGFIREPDIKLALKKLNNLRILCAIREGEQGLYALNNAVELYLRNKKLITRSGEFYANRPIIITRNYYDLGLFNGDVGLVRPDENGVLKAWFEDSNKELKPGVLPGYISDAETVFAMTIHKSQGSEYDKVLVVLPKQDMPLLTRELLYTAVTRAKSKAFIQATAVVILSTAAAAVSRVSGIMERFDE